jgi:hypothetical protein
MSVYLLIICFLFILFLIYLLSIFPGTLVGCLRRLLNWSLNSTLSEFKTFGANRTIRLADEQFIEFFDVDLVTLPKILPPWFIEQRKMAEEELKEQQNEG